MMSGKRQITVEGKGFAGFLAGSPAAQQVT